jgi:hypothetical protein
LNEEDNRMFSVPFEEFLRLRDGIQHREQGEPGAGLEGGRVPQSSPAQAEQIEGSPQILQLEQEDLAEPTQSKLNPSEVVPATQGSDGSLHPVDEEAQEEVMRQEADERRRTKARELDLEKLREELRLGAELEEQIRSELEELREAREEQRRRIEEAGLRLRAEYEEQTRHDMVALRKVADEQRKRIETAEALRAVEAAEQIRLAELARARSEQQLNETEEAVRHLTEQTRQHIAELEALLEAAEAELSEKAKLENELSLQLADMQRRTKELVRSIEKTTAKRSAAAAEQIRIADLARANAERELRETEEAVCQLTEQVEQQLEALATVRTAAEADLRSKVLQEEHLRGELDGLTGAIQQQERRNHELNVVLEARSAAKIQREEELRQLDEVVKTVCAEEMDLSEKVRTAEASRNQYRKSLEELEFIRAQTEEEVRQGSEQVEILKGDVELLRASATRQAKEIEEALKLMEAEEEALKKSAAAALVQHEKERKRLDEMAVELSVAHSNFLAVLKARETRLKEDAHAFELEEDSIRIQIHSLEETLVKQTQRMSDFKRFRQQRGDQVVRGAQHYHSLLRRERRRRRETHRQELIAQKQHEEEQRSLAEAPEIREKEEHSRLHEEVN